MRAVFTALMLAFTAPCAAAPVAVPASTLPAPTLAAIDHLFAVIHLADTFDGLVAQAIPILLQPLATANPGRDADVRRIVTEELTRAFADRRAIYLAAARESYGRHFTVTEIDEIAAFFETPTGRKMQREQLPISRELSEFSRAVGQQAGREAAARIAERLKAAKLAVPSVS